MTAMGAIAVGLAMGAIFGIALEKSRVFEPAVLIGQFQFRNFILLKVLLSAVATGLVVLAVMQGLGIARIHPKATVYVGDLLGGLLLGSGIVIAGACPGTILAQIGAGYRDAWATLVGGLFGAMAFGYLEPVLRPLIQAGSPGRLTVHGMIGLPFWVVALPLAAVLVLVLVVLERQRPWRDDLGRNLDGLTDKPGLKVQPDRAGELAAE